MAQPTKIEASLEGPLFVSAGSFWSTSFQETDKVRVLIETMLRNQMLGSFNNAVQNFTGDHQLASLRRHVFVTFEQNDIIETGSQMFNGPPTNTYGLNTDAPTVYGDYRIQYWVLPLKGILPVALQAKDRQLLIGVDFFIQAGRYIFFRQDPRVLFPSGGYLVVRGYVLENSSYVSYFTQTHAPGNDDLIVAYFRKSQTPQYFKLALAAVGRLGIIKKGGQLLSAVATDNGTQEIIYVFPDEAVRVNYRHAPLVVGRTYAPLTIIGDAIQVFQAGLKDVAWWRQLNWRGGLLLDPLMPGIKGVPLPDNWCPAYVAGQDHGSNEGSKSHAQIRLGGEWMTEQEFWDRVKLNEQRSGFYLNSVIGLPNEDETETFAQLVADTDVVNAYNLQHGYPMEVPDVASLPNVKLVNPLDVFFQAVLGQVGMIVAFDQSRLRHQKAVFDFLGREMPAGCCPVIIGFVPDVIDSFDKFAGALTEGESVVMATNALFNFVDTLMGDEIENETVTVTQLYPNPD